MSDSEKLWAEIADLKADMAQLEKAFCETLKTQLQLIEILQGFQAAFSRIGKTRGIVAMADIQ